MNKTMSNEASDLTILLIGLILFGVFNGWLLMIGAGILHSAIDTPTIGFFPTAFWLGVIYTMLSKPAAASIHPK